MFLPGAGRLWKPTGLDLEEICRLSVEIKKQHGDVENSLTYATIITLSPSDMITLFHPVDVQGKAHLL